MLINRSIRPYPAWGNPHQNLSVRYHLKKDTPDARDHIYTASRLATPQIVDLRSYCSAIEDQGNLGSCTGNAVAGAIELIDRLNSKPLEISRLFIYYQERLLEGTVGYDAGAMIRDGFKACNQKGAPLESLWPYTISKFKTAPSAQAYADAATRKITAYQRCLTFTDVITALTNRQPVVIGFDVYTSFESVQVARTGVMPFPNVRGEQYLGGHAVVLVGYNNTTQRFIARNSWGTSWGDRGYFYMPYRVIQDTTMSGDFWTLSRVNNP